MASKLYGEMHAWRDPDLDVRILVNWITPLVDVGGQYIAPKADFLLLWNYVKRIGVRNVVRKVRSRLAERVRNQKVAAFGVGRVTEGPASRPDLLGARICFFAPSVSTGTSTIVLRADLVRLAPDTLPAVAPPAGDIALPPGLVRYVAWSPFMGTELERVVIDDGILKLIDDSSVVSGPRLAERRFELAGLGGGVGEQVGASPLTRKPTVAIFGLGNYAKQQIVPNLPSSLTLSCVHELDPLQLAGWGQRDLLVDTCPWPRELERYDLWFVAGYHHTHTPIALTALRRGGAVAIEKPIATTRDQLEALRAELLKDPAAKLYSCFQRRYAKYNQWTREDLGIVPGAAVHYSCIVFEIPIPQLHWYSWPSSRSRIISNGCHWIDHFMMLNEYEEVRDMNVISSGDHEISTFIELNNGAIFSMRLTQQGSARIGVRDHVEISCGTRTAFIESGRNYAAESSRRILRTVSVNPMDVYGDMYREICRKFLAGAPGDTVESLRSSMVAIELDEMLAAKRHN